MLGEGRAGKQKGEMIGREECLAREREAGRDNTGKQGMAGRRSKGETGLESREL